MRSTATTPNEYLQSLPEERREIVSAIRDVLLENLPAGFAETMGYGMLGFVVPLTLYPAGYHCQPGTPLPFISLASQKNYISLYHMGLSEGALLDWFRLEWPRHTTQKLDMGKCCVRFKKPHEVPLELIAGLARRVTPQQWISYYEEQVPSTMRRR